MTLTPKEKAKQLVDKYMPMTKQFVTTIGWVESPELAKECALLCVDEILNSKPVEPLHWSFPSEYWQKVKQEIEKL